MRRSEVPKYAFKCSDVLSNRVPNIIRKYIAEFLCIWFIV